MTLPRRTSMMVLSLAVITPMTLTGCVSITTSKPAAPTQEEAPAPAKEIVAEPVVELAPALEVVPESQLVEPAGHTVAPGDTLAAIAAAYGWGTAEELAAANGITDVNLIFVGQVIHPPAPQVVTAVVSVEPSDQPGTDLVSIPVDLPATVEQVVEQPKVVLEKEPVKAAPAPKPVKEKAPGPAPVVKTPTPTAPPVQTAPPVVKTPEEPAPVEAPPVETPPVEVAPDFPADAVQAELLALVNDYRMAAGIAPLQWDAGSSAAAGLWAAVTCEAIVNHGAQGFAKDPSWAGAQLIAVNSNAVTVLAALQSNPDHNAVLLDPSLTTLGFGYAMLPGGSTYGPQMVAVLNTSSAAHMVDNTPLNEETP